MHYLTPFAFDPDQTGTDPHPIVSGPQDLVAGWARLWGTGIRPAHRRLCLLERKGKARRVGKVGRAHNWEVWA